MLSSVYSTVQRGVSIHEYKAMNFSLINGCGTHKNNICGHSFIWSDACEFTKYYNCYKKGKQTSVRKNL